MLEYLNQFQENAYKNILPFFSMQANDLQFQYFDEQSSLQTQTLCWHKLGELP